MAYELFVDGTSIPASISSLKVSDNGARIAVYAHTIDDTEIYDGGADGFYWCVTTGDGRVLNKVTYIDHSTSGNPLFNHVHNNGIVLTP